MIPGLDVLLPGPERPRDSWRWATVTQVSPLRVRLDGDDAALPVTPDSLLVTPPYVGQRVRVHVVDRSIVVVGAASAGQWTAWTPTLSTPSGSPTLGSGGTLVGRYTRIGATVIGHAILTLGTGFAAGSGRVQISLPVAGATNTFIGDARIRANNTYTRAQVLCQGAYVIFRYYPAAVNATSADVSFSASAPATWTSGDQIHAEFTYEAA